jgi:hypothetical protein
MEVLGIANYYQKILPIIGELSVIMLTIYLSFARALQAMNIEKFEEAITIISRGDTSIAEALFSKPGGRKYFESIVAVVVSTLPGEAEEKEHLFRAFIKGLDRIEYRIKHQRQGQKILKQLYR